MIEFCNVTFKHQYDDFALLENASFNLPNGISTVLCDVQSGKTSICRLILGLLTPQSGKISVDGEDVSVCRPDVLYLPKEPTLFLEKSVSYNLNYPSKVRKILPQNSERIHQIAHKFALDEKLGTKAKKLSKMEKLQLALARGMTVERKIVLFDGFFDNNYTESFSQVVNEYFPFCQTAVLFTAFPQNAVGHTVVLENKKCVFQGEVSQAQEVVKNLCWLATK